ncbi:MAG: cyclically-permuted mutarotase family protein [Cetobacterium sp.]
MKKIALGLVVLSLGVTGCSTGTIKNKEMKEITWKHIGDLPVPKGFEKQYGVAGPLAGHIGEYVIIAGGANFPYKPVLEGGAKVVYSDLYLMKKTSDGLELVKHTHLPKEIGYGSAISTEKGIYYIGGTYQTGVSNEIIFVGLNKDKTDIEVKTIGKLPFEYHSGVAVLKGDDIFIVAGKQNGKDSKNFYKYNLSTGKTSELKMFPGTERSQPVGQILHNGKEEMLYVFGGGTGVAFTDGYAYSFSQDSWSKAKDVVLNNHGISVLGANSVKLDSSKMLVIGGFNKEIWDDANLKLGSLKGEALKNYRESYFNKDPQDFNWNKNMLVYNAKTNTWESMGEIPFMAPCGEGLVKIGDTIYSINGEIKPGIRSPRIYEGKLK